MLFLRMVLIFASLFGAAVTAQQQMQQQQPPQPPVTNGVPPPNEMKKGPTPTEEAEYTQDFHGFDSNGDGFLDAQEIRSGFNGEVAESEVTTIYGQSDHNGDGVVSKQEYIDYAAALANKDDMKYDL